MQGQVGQECPGLAGLEASDRSPSDVHSQSAEHLDPAECGHPIHYHPQTVLLFLRYNRSVAKTAILIPSLCLLAALDSYASDLDDRIEKMRAERGTPGVSIVVARAGKILYAKGFGVENIETGRKMTPDSIHELASVSKNFTAAAILRLAQEGRLSLGDSISKYFPSDTKNWDSITIEHLLRHTSGLPDYLASINITKEYTSDQLVATIRQKPLRFTPGSKWEYSNSGYMLLGFVVEKVAKTSLADYMAKTFFKPLGMRNSFGNDPTSSRAAKGYSKIGNKVVEQGKTSKSLSLTGDGQVMSSAVDLAKWDAALWINKVLDATRRKLLFEPGRVPMAPGNPNSPHYGMGWVIGKSQTGRPIANHGGGWMGTATLIHRDLDSKTVFIVLCNADFEDPSRYLPLLTERFLSK